MKKDKQDIGQIFKHKLSNVSVSPNKTVWSNIEKELKKQRKKKFLFWLYTSIIIVLISLILVLILKQNVSSNQEKELPKVTINQKKYKSSEENPKTFNNLSNSKSKRIHIKKSTSTIKSEQEKNTSNTILYPHDITQKTGGSLKKEQNKLFKTTTEDIKSSKEKNSFTGSKLNTIKKTASNDIINRDKDINHSKNPEEKNLKSEEKSNNNANNTVTSIQKSIIEKIISSNTKKNDILNKKKAINYSEKPEEKVLKLGKKDNSKSNNIATNLQKSIIEKITSNNITKSDSLKKTINYIEEQIEKVTIDKKISVSSYVAPLILNPFTKRSTLDEQLDTLPSINKATLSYGAYLKFKVNKRLGFRLGGGVLNLEKATENIATSGIINLEPFNISSLPINLATNITDTQIASFFNNNPITLTQEISYIEIPLELSYLLIDKKLKLDLIGGLSSLFLTKNRIQIERDNATLTIGEATNLSEFNFSFNISAGLYYNLTKRIQFNFEPFFKYQINARNGNTNTVDLYHLGIQTGFTWKF